MRNKFYRNHKYVWAAINDVERLIAKFKSCILLLGLLPISLQAMDQPPQEDHILEGIFSTKIQSLLELDPNAFEEGDIAFYCCDTQWSVKGKESCFLKQCRENGVVCLHLDRRWNYEDQWYQERNVQFTNLFNEKKILDKNTYLLNGFIRNLGNNFWAHEKIQLAVKFLQNSGVFVKRIIYFCDDLPSLGDLLGKSLPLVSIIYFLPINTHHNEYLSFYARFWLSDEATAHWAFTLSSEQMVEYIHENPFILAKTYEGPNDKRITYKEILDNSLLQQAFSNEKLLKSSPLIRSIIYYEGDRLEYVQWLVSRYKETLWPELVSHMEKILELPITYDKFLNEKNFVYKSLLDELAHADGFIDLYAQQIKILFNKLGPPHLRKSVLQSMALIPFEKKVEALQLQEEKYPFEAVCSLAQWAVFQQPGESGLFIAEICALNTKTIPFEIVCSLKESLPKELNSPNFRNFAFVLARFYNFSDNKHRNLNEVLKKFGPQLWRISTVLDQLHSFRAEIFMKDAEEENLYNSLIALDIKDVRELSPLFSALTWLLTKIPRAAHANFDFRELVVLFSQKDPETSASCAKATNQIIKSPLFSSDFVFVLRAIMALPSNRERQIVGDGVYRLLNKPFILRIHEEKARLKMAVFKILKIPVSHQEFFFKLIENIHESFVFNVYGQITALAEEIHKVPVDQFQNILDKVPTAKEIGGLRTLLGFTRW